MYRLPFNRSEPMNYIPDIFIKKSANHMKVSNRFDFIPVQFRAKNHYFRTKHFDSSGQETISIWTVANDHMWNQFCYFAANYKSEDAKSMRSSFWGWQIWDFDNSSKLKDLVNINRINTKRSTENYWWKNWMEKNTSKPITSISRDCINPR